MSTTSTISNDNLMRARSAWAGKPPEWVVALAGACDETSQGKVAKRLGISTTVINQVLGAKYTGRMDRFESRVRGEFLRATVICPVLGTISTRRCQDEQAQPFTTASRLAARLTLACRTCPNRRES